MALTDREVFRGAAFGLRRFRFYRPSIPNNQSVNVDLGLWVPWQGLRRPPQPIYGWLVESVQAFCTGLTAGLNSVDVLGGFSSVLVSPVVPVAGAVVGGQLGGNQIGRMGKPGDLLRVRVLTDGTGSMTDLNVYISMRAAPLNLK